MGGLKLPLFPETLQSKLGKSKLCEKNTLIFENGMDPIALEEEEDEEENGRTATGEEKKQVGATEEEEEVQNKDKGSGGSQHQQSIHIQPTEGTKRELQVGDEDYPRGAQIHQEGPKDLLPCDQCHKGFGGRSK